MRKTAHYELNLVEGSDIVNPLVQDVPNYETIDEELFKNANAGVPLATELLSGTVHALTRENPNASMFRFVATSNYKSGDTFTVDGVQVTALLTTGVPLGEGAYVINSNVLCCLVGTVLTMFCANSVVDIHASDSDKLGGKDANYYASTESVVNAVNLAQSANQISLDNKTGIMNLTNKVPFSFGVDGDGNYGYYGADDSLIPFSSLKVKLFSGSVTNSKTLECNIGDLIICNAFSGLSFTGADLLHSNTRTPHSTNSTKSISYVLKATSKTVQCTTSATSPWLYIILG